MAGLVSYESSDEEEVAPQPKSSKPLKQSQDATVVVNREPSVTAKPDASPEKEVEQQQPAAIFGPQIGPTPAAGPSFPPLEEAPMDDDEGGSGSGLPPGSPYTATRALLRDLTLPPLPNTDIPPSPPGTPPPATSAKFERFLELKKQGVHFNTRIAQNPSMSNPALMDKLLTFVELGGPADQYRTTLGEDVWDPAGFPRWAYKEQLRQSQLDVEKARARGKGAPVDFVAASTSAAASGGDHSAAALQGSSQGGAPKQSAGKRKTRFDA
ncbi:HCNGP-like protein-domain-containing protein [Hypoxylon cercidicola]|nr:HCNGP-like protein-domain-containing protein [Hypoxylon cercidicola]